LRTKAGTIATIKKQIATSGCPQNKSRNEASFTQTGVKDQVAYAQMLKLYEFALDAGWTENSLSAKIKNILLGPVKYLLRATINQFAKTTKSGQAKRKSIALRLSSLSFRGLKRPINGYTIVDFVGSLVGRDFKAVAQIAPFAFDGLIDDKWLRVWMALSQLHVRLYQRSITNLDEYCREIEFAVEQVLFCFVDLEPGWLKKPKLHVLVHLPSMVREFGPPLLYATERFESHNSNIRDRSIHSNRAAPSRDIALGFRQLDTLRHLVSGGYWNESGTWMRSGEQVRQYIHCPQIRAMLGCTSDRVYEVGNGCCRKPGF
jgi:hypothetical protein